MKVHVLNRCAETSSYRAARVKAMFNCESGATFEREFDIGADPDGDWSIGLIVGPSGSGKTSAGRLVFPDAPFLEPGGVSWPKRAPVIDAISPGGSFDHVTGCLSAVGLGDVPAWLRPYSALSTGERFRADLARVVAEAPPRVVIDEFTSTVDRQIARIGAHAFARSWRRTGGKAVLLSCHYDIQEWLRPDWTLDTATGAFSGRYLQPRPPIHLDIHRTDWRHWPTFEPHHYLKIPRMIAAVCYVGSVESQLVAHVAVATVCYGRNGFEARACRLVVMPEWQGAGVGTRFLDTVCQIQLDGADGSVMPGLPLSTAFHTSHPGLCQALRRRKGWSQISARLYGQHKGRCKATLERSGNSRGTGYGGHFRAIQGFRYHGKGA